MGMDKDVLEYLKIRRDEMKRVAFRTRMVLKFYPPFWVSYFIAPSANIPDKIYREMYALYVIMKTEYYTPDNVYIKLLYVEDEIDDEDDPILRYYNDEDDP
jgi:hypothetical protein